jgi:hypothetical protein
MRLVDARNREANWLGAGGEKQPVVRHLAPIGERNLARAGIDPGDVHVEAQVDALLRIETGCAERQPLFRCFASQIVLRQVWPVDGRSGVIAQHDDAAPVLLTPQSLGGCKPGRPPAENDDPFRNFAGDRASRRGF